VLAATFGLRAPSLLASALLLIMTVAKLRVVNNRTLEQARTEAD
jgi:hypothetical protein